MISSLRKLHHNSGVQLVQGVVGYLQLCFELLGFEEAKCMCNLPVCSVEKLAAKESHQNLFGEQIVGEQFVKYFFILGQFCAFDVL